MALPLGSRASQLAVSLLVFLFFGCPACILAQSESESRKPNIIFIMADDLGYGDLGCYGQKRIGTPNLDKLASEGMKFTDFYSGSTVCAPSRCVLMTGYHTGRAFIRGNARDNLRPEDVTIAEVLREKGYRTGLAGKWGLGHEGSTGLPTKQGFDFFYGYLNQRHAHNYYPAFLIDGEKRVQLKNKVPSRWKDGAGKASEKVEYSHDLVMNRAVSFVERNHKKPFFLFLSLTIPHANNEAGRAGMEVPDLGQYADKDWPAAQKGHAAMISRMDKGIGRIRKKLKELNIDNNTLIFFTSDNGPHAEGGNDPHFNDSNGPLKGIKRSLHEGGIRVPMIAHWPGRIKAGSVSNHIGCFQDVMPMLADIAGGSSLVPYDIDGLSFAPKLLGQPENQKRHSHLYWAFYERGGARAIRAGKWKAIQQPIHSKIRLYNLANDLGERTDVAKQNADLVKELKKKMDESYQYSSRWRFPAKKRKKAKR